MEENFQYRIGLDIGITSVGWAVLQNNSQDEPVRITDLGVRIFDVAENPKNGCVSSSQTGCKDNPQKIETEKTQIRAD